MFPLQAFYWGQRGACDNFALQIRNLVEHGYSSLREKPVVIGECGIQMDMNKKEAFVTEDFTWQTRMMDAMMTALERSLVGFTLWTYNPSNNDQIGDDWNGENFSWFSSKRALPRSLLYYDQDAPSVDNGGRILPAVVRPYPAKTAGIPLKFEYEMSSGAFTCEWANTAPESESDDTHPIPTVEGVPRSGHPKLTALETEIFLPSLITLGRKVLVDGLDETDSYMLRRAAADTVYCRSGYGSEADFGIYYVARNERRIRCMSLREQRLERDPTLDVCPDFSSEHFEPMRALMRNNNLTDEQAIEALTQAWTQQNADLRARWTRQVEEEQARAEAAAQGEPDRGAQQPEEENRGQEPATADDRQEQEKKSKSKLRDFDPNLSVAGVLPPRPSSYAFSKIASFEYVELWYFTQEGCRDAQSSQRTEADDTFGVSRLGDLVTFRPVASVQAAKRALQDADLTWEQFHYANRSFISHIDKAGWPPQHVQALLHFFLSLESSPYLDREHGRRIVLTYQARVRRSWMDLMKDSEAQVFNIAIINNTLMESIANEIQSSVTADMQRQMHAAIESLKALQTTSAERTPRKNRAEATNAIQSLEIGRAHQHQPRGGRPQLCEPNRRFLAQAQAPTAHPPVPYASGDTDTRSANAPQNCCGTEILLAASATTVGGSSTPRGSSSAPTGNDPKAAAPSARTMFTSVPDAERRTTALRRALEHRGSNALSPYIADAWEHLLCVHNLLTIYSNIPSGLRLGFDAGIKPIYHTRTPDNGTSLHTYPQAHAEIIEKEFKSRRYLGPFSQSEVESFIGPFQTSPLSLVPKPGKPNKFRAVHNFSFPLAKSARYLSINYSIESDHFPCTWGTFATVCNTIWHLPPDSQASIRDVAEAYRTIPIRPEQWPGLVVKLREPDSFAINTNNNFGLTSAGGIYGIVGDAGTDIFRAEGIGPISKWVDDHIFFRILRAHRDEYNKQRATWNTTITANGGRLQDRSRFWYCGDTMPNGFPAEFDEDCRFPIKDLSGNSPRSPLDTTYTYSSADIDAISQTLGIPWEASKTIEFSFSVQYLGFVWDLQERTVSVPEGKKAKYLQAITEWKSSKTHSLDEVQRLYGKLLHTSLVVPAGRAYLTQLEAMLGSFRDRPFTPHHSPSGTAQALEWWSTVLQQPCIYRRIPGPCILIDRQAYSDASSGIGIGITIGNRWRAWRLIPGWQTNGRDIGWAEAIGFELLVRTLLMVSSDGDEFKVFGDNRGVVEGWWKGRSRNKPTNEVFRRIHHLLGQYGCAVHTRYVPSDLNPADKPSRGKYYPYSLLLPAIPISDDLASFIVDFDSPLHPHELHDRRSGRSPAPLPKPPRDLSSLEEQPNTRVQSRSWRETLLQEAADW
ncbi:putative tyrosine recombinase [Lyophyllum shimeji]|uniref:Tyrosine recombinase n=1 Tax=Lyophyllum shimeji TaxID=47721 RepID=A0A9P3PW07_LYOSH|nr:putative tyrosine recombinase [Lyophyllum shimeji]